MQTPAIRERVVAMLANVDMKLAEASRAVWACPAAEPLPTSSVEPEPEVTQSPALSLFAGPGEQGIRTRRIAILVADGVDVASARHPRASGGRGRSAQVW